MSAGTEDAQVPKGTTTAVLVVPQGTHAVAPLAEALRGQHPDWAIVAVWCGDPQLRPALPTGVTWRSAPGADGELELASLGAHHVEWRRALTVVAAELDLVERVVLLWVGAVAVLGPLDGLLVDGTGLVAHLPGAPPDDDLEPGATELAVDGRISTHVAAFTRRSTATIRWLTDLIADDDVAVGRWLDVAALRPDVVEVADELIGASAWRWPDGEPSLVIAPGFDAERPWLLDPTISGEGRVSIAADPQRLHTIERALDQLSGERTAMCLPGAIEIDATIRRLVAAAKVDPPQPWSEPLAFRQWLAARYWNAQRDHRGDLQAIFPDPLGADAEGFRRWSSAAFIGDDVPFLLQPAGTLHDSLRVADRLGDEGINLVGYHGLSASLGDVVRRLHGCLDAVGTPVSTIAATRSASPPLADAVPTDELVAYRTTLAVVTADQLPYQRADHPALFAASERMIGYWFWELEHIPEHMRRQIALVDEIWAGSQFVTEAFAAVAEVPVHWVPIPVAEPQRADRGRADFPVLAGLGARTVFLVTLDHFSITERKNPLGAIAAFRRAFAPDAGPVLVVKTTNAAGRWVQHEALIAAASGRDDIVVWDEHLVRADQMALVAAADCLVSLHRSEGLGLHLAEAMWLGTPTIATRYSGNLDFMDDECSLLIDAEMVNVRNGQGIYPPEALWAEPDVDQAAAAMRRLASESDLGTRLAADALARMKMQPTLADTGRLIQRRLQRAD